MSGTLDETKGLIKEKVKGKLETTVGKAKDRIRRGAHRAQLKVTGGAGERE